MSTILLVIHILLAIALVLVILIQRNEGGMGGLGGGGGTGMMTSRSAANLLTRSTAIIAALFMVNSVALAIVSGVERGSILDTEPAIVTPVGDASSDTPDTAGGDDATATLPAPPADAGAEPVSTDAAVTDEPAPEGSTTGGEGGPDAQEPATDTAPNPAPASTE